MQNEKQKKYFVEKKADGSYNVKAHVEKDKDGNVKVFVPSIPLIQKIIKEEKLKQNNGERNI